MDPGQGALGNFQFMPSSIKLYGIDYNKDGIIDLKNLKRIQLHPQLTI